MGLNILTTNIQISVDTLAPEKTLHMKKNKYSWINSELRLLKSKIHATDKRLRRTGSRQLSEELHTLTRSYEKRSEMAHRSYMHNCICSSLDANKNFWRDMMALRLIPKTNYSLHGFLPKEMMFFQHFIF